jgi:hypothetical protein
VPRKKVVASKRRKPVPKLAAVNHCPTSFIGSIKGTMKILGDIVSPLDLKWEADAE